MRRIILFPFPVWPYDSFSYYLIKARLLNIKMYVLIFSITVV
jgi:hypothetical protein